MHIVLNGTYVLCLYSAERVYLSVSEVNGCLNNAHIKALENQCVMRCLGLSCNLNDNKKGSN